LRALPGTDGVRALRAALKTLLRRYGLRCVSVEVENIDQRDEEAGNGRDE
jgi:hypothetical protein